MKRVLGITFGGIQRKTLELTIALIIITALAFTGVSVYQNRALVEIVAQTRTEQEKAISSISQETMLGIQQNILTDMVSLQASIADADLSEIVTDAYILKTMAESMLKSQVYRTPESVSPPDASMDGTSSAYVLCEEGVNYTDSKSLMRIAHLGPAMVAMHANSGKIDCCYIALEDGTFYCVDEKASAKLDENGDPLMFNFHQRPWYRGAIMTGTLFFTGIIRDSFSGDPLVTCSIPITVSGGVVGVVGIDIMIEGVSSFIHNASGSSTAVFIANKDGQIILSSDTNGVFVPNSAERLMDRTGSSLLTSLVNNALTDTTGLNHFSVGGRQYYMAGAPVPTVGWAVVIAVDKEQTEQHEKQLLSSYNEINDSAKALFNEKSGRIKTFANVLFFMIIVLGIVASYIAARRVARPIENITRDIVKCGETNTFFEMKDTYRTNDEIETLAQSFATLSKKTKSYIDNITEITAERERASTEMALAAQIQSSMLPHNVPAFPDRTDFDILGSMDPAREVGGDFYDYFFIDDDHLYMVIADVSGKGVPAALFMMSSKTILQSAAMQGASPAEILTRTNNAICSSNDAEMFVTVWVGILELSTGKLTAANAGHEYPAIMRAGGGFELLKDKHGFVIGGMAGMKYKEYELLLNPGDKLFVYTDGVPEATDCSNALFGTDRMIDALNRNPDLAPEGILNSVSDAVNSFVMDAEQFDDLTMLCLEYKGPNDGRKT